MINIKIEKEKKEKPSIGSLTATDWLNNIKENKELVNGKEKNIISPMVLLSNLYKKGYLNKLSRKKGYLPNEKYFKKKYFEVVDFDVLDKNNNVIKTTHTIYFTSKGQKKLLKIVLQLIKEKKKNK